MTFPGMAVSKAGPSAPSELRAALSLGWLMALHDTRMRYRGSILGPLWLTANLAATGLGVSFMYAALFHIPYQTYLAYLMTGLVVWAFVFQVLSEASTAFIAAAGVIRNVRLPLLSHVFRVLFRQAIIMAHNLLVLILILVLTGQLHPWGIVPAFLNLFLVAIALLPAIAILAMLGVRFRDVPQIVTNLLQFIMFLTPIFWRAEDASGRGAFIYSNPFYHLIALFRQPLLGGPLAWQSYAVVGGIAVVGLVIAALAFRWGRDRIVFWV